MRTLTWEDAEEIALALLAKYPHQDPLRLRFTDLRNWVIHLEGFADDPTASSEGALESIQMAWWEEWKDSTVGWAPSGRPQPRDCLGRPLWGRPRLSPVAAHARRFGKHGAGQAARGLCVARRYLVTVSVI